MESNRPADEEVAQLRERIEDLEGQLADDADTIDDLRADRAALEEERNKWQQKYADLREDIERCLR